MKYSSHAPKPSFLIRNPIVAGWDELVHRMHDPRSIGYLAAALILCLVLGISWHLWQVTLSGQQKAWVRFEHNTEAISALQTDDPVVISGVLVGRVDHIEPIDDGAVVLVTFYNYQKLRADATAINFPQGLMGQRIVLIDRGSSPIMFRDGGTMPGTFQPSIAETMSRIRELAATVDAVRVQEDLLIRGDGSHDPLATRINSILASLSLAAGKLDTVTAFATNASAQLPRVTAASRGIRTQLGNANGVISRADTKLDPTLDQLSRDIESLRPLVKRANELDRQLHDTSSAIIRALHDTTLYGQANALNRSAREIEDIIRDGEEKQIDFPMHFNIWRSLRFRRPERK